MRTAIITRLKTIIPLISHIQPDIATKETTKPYTVTRQANETEGNIKVAYNLSFNIYCCAEKGNYINLDTLVKNVIQALNNIELTTSDSKVFKLKYNGFIGSEFYDSDFDVITQGLLFTTINIHE